MKVKVNEEIAVDVEITQTHLCPAGTAYYTVGFLVEGLCIHTATTGAIYGSPDIIALLDRKYTERGPYVFVEKESDLPMQEGMVKTGRVSNGKDTSKPAWWTERTLTHRDAIIESYGQLIMETIL